MIKEFSAGGIVYKKERDRVLWLVRKPKGNSDYRGNLGWTLPKGWIDKGETVEQAALRETAEEGGIRARVVFKLPAFKVFFTNQDGHKVIKLITYFVMEWLEDLKEGFGEETEEIKWVIQSEAEELLAYKNEKALLGEAAGKI